MLRRNWLDLARKLVDRYDLDYSFSAVSAAVDEIANSFWGEGVLTTTVYPNPFPFTMSGAALGGTVGNGIAYDVNGQICRIDTSSPTAKTFVNPAANLTNPRWDLLVISYVQTGNTPIPKPSDPILTVNLNLIDDFVLTVIPGTPSPTPAYPAKTSSGQIVLAGIRVPAGATLGTSCTVDYSVRENAMAGIVQNPTIIPAEIPAGLVNGSNTSFTLAHAPLSPQSVKVIIDGLTLSPVDWSIIGQVVTMAIAPAAGQGLRVWYIQNTPTSQNPLSGASAHLGIGDGSTVSFSITGLPAGQQTVEVYLDGLWQDPSLWSLLAGVGSAAIIFGSAPVIGQSVDIFYLLSSYSLGTTSVQGASNEGSGAGLVGVFDTEAGAILKFKSLRPLAGATVLDEGDGTIGIGATGSGGGSDIHGSQASPISVVAATGLQPTSAMDQIWWIKPSSGSGAIALSSILAPISPIPGQRLTVMGPASGAARWFTIADGAGTDQNGNATIDSTQALVYIWNGSAWYQISNRL